MRPPLAWTASVTRRHQAIRLSEQMPGAPAYPLPRMETGLASETIRPPSEARCVSYLTISPRQWRHYNAVGQLIGADLGRRAGLGHRASFGKDWVKDGSR